MVPQGALHPKSVAPRADHSASSSSLRALVGGAALSAALLSTLVGSAAIQLSRGFRELRPVHVNLGEVSWLGDVSLGLAAPAPALAVASASVDQLSLVASHPEIEPKPAIKHRRARHALAHLAHVTHARPARHVAIAQTARASRKVGVTQAPAPQRQSVVALAPVALQAPVVSVAAMPAVVSTQEKAKLRAVAFSLRHQFLTVMLAPSRLNTQTVAVTEVQIQPADKVASATPSPASAPVVHVLQAPKAATPEESKEKSADTSPAIQEVGRDDSAPAAGRAGPYYLAKNDGKADVFAYYGQLLKTFEAPSAYDIATQEAGAKQGQPHSGESAGIAAATSDEDAPQPAKQEQVQPVIPAPTEVQNDPSPEARAEVEARVEATAREQQEMELPLSLDLPSYSGLRKQAEYSDLTKPSVIGGNPAVNIHLPGIAPKQPQKVVNTQPLKPATVVPPPAVVATVASVGQEGARSEATDKIVTEVASARQAPKPEEHPASSFVEALSAVAVSVPVNVWDYTHEGAQSDSAIRPHWRVASAPDHWKTLFWAGAESGASVPLLSDATAWILSRLSEAEVQKDAGIVLGRIAAGWRLQFTGRAEPVIYLNDEQQRVADEDLSSARYFVLLNVEPGSHLLHLQNPARGESGAVGAPVLSGAVTALDLSQSKSVIIRGWVVSAKGRDASGVSGVPVRLVGKTGASAVTSKTGAFTIKGGVQFAGMPEFLEAESHEGYMHRYQTQLTGPEEVLYLFDQAQVDSWVGQLPGGVSPESGIIVAALPKFIASHPEALKPSIHPIQKDATLIPETYSLSAVGQLQPGQPVSPESARFIGAQLPKGFVKVQLSSESGTAWSVLTYTSKNVISVLGPQ